MHGLLAGEPVGGEDGQHRFERLSLGLGEFGIVGMREPVASYSALWDLYLALKKIKNAGLADMNDPTGLGSRFGACSSESKRDEAMSKLETAVGRALKAKDYASDGYHALAIEQLELLFNQ